MASEKKAETKAEQKPTKDPDRLKVLSRSEHEKAFPHKFFCVVKNTLGRPLSVDFHPGKKGVMSKKDSEGRRVTQKHQAVPEHLLRSPGFSITLTGLEEKFFSCVEQGDLQSPQAKALENNGTIKIFECDKDGNIKTETLKDKKGNPIKGAKPVPKRVRL